MTSETPQQQPTPPMEKPQEMINNMSEQQIINFTI